MGFIIAVVLIGAVVIAGGGNSLKGLGIDLKNTGNTLEQKVNGREPDTNKPVLLQPVEQLPARHTYGVPAGTETIPAAK